MKSEYVIEAPIMADLDCLVDFQMNLASESEGVRLDSQSLRLGVKNVLQDANKGEYVVIRHNSGQLVAMLLLTREWSDWRNGNVLWIQSVYVAKDHRRKGLYRALYSHVKERVTSRDDLAGLRLYVENDNQNAHVVYRNLGMDGHRYSVFEWLKTDH